MRLIYISCNVSMLSEIEELLNKCKVDSYQIVEQAKSVNKIGDPRLNNAVWPGYNSLFFVNTDSDQIYNNLISELKQYNKSVDMPDEKICVTSWKTEEYFWD